MADMIEGAVLKKAVRCPKCQGRHLTMLQVWHGSTAYDFDKNGVCVNAPRYGETEHTGDIWMKRVEGICMTCKHHWTLRKILFVDDMIDAGASPRQGDGDTKQEGQ